METPDIKKSLVSNTAYAIGDPGLALTTSSVKRKNKAYADLMHLEDASDDMSIPGAAVFGATGLVMPAIKTTGHIVRDRRVQIPLPPATAGAPPPVIEEEETMPAMRIVKVYIADPNENIMPPEKRILFTGEEKATELTDQELFFEINIKELLDKHNAYRITITDRKASDKFGRDVKLEPIRIKDLKMVVASLAEF